MNDMPLIVIVIILMVPSAVSFVWFLVTIANSFKKLESLGDNIKEKIYCAGYENHMSLVRNLTREELIKLGSLTEDEIKEIGNIHNYKERIKTAKERVEKMNLLE